MKPTRKPPIEGLPFYVAHTPSKQNPQWHPLINHALDVTDKAVGFAEPFGGRVLARYLGLLHDLGKFDDGFQLYLYQHYLADNGRGTRPEKGAAPHKQAGAIVAAEAGRAAGGTLEKASGHIAQAIFGHHSGIKDPADSETAMEQYQQKAVLTVPEMREIAGSLNQDLDPALPPLDQLIPSPHNTSPEAREMFLRFAYSCLTDADGLDTEAHHEPAVAQRRAEDAQKAPSLAALRDCLRERQEKLMAKARRKHPNSTVNAVRERVYRDCCKAAALPPGVFTLTVPTGGGKTRSALMFALEHAVCHAETHGFRRVIYVAPFTSILDQTALTFRRIFSRLLSEVPVVLEHHSAVDTERPGDTEDEGDWDMKEQWRRVAAQNWDARIIATTTVQLFESLYSNRPGKCRKLHRIAKSILILDEAQALPPHLLSPLTSALGLLARNFGVTVVLCTATQPALEKKTAFFKGLTPAPREIVREPGQHFEVLKRVRYVPNLTPRPLSEIGDELTGGLNEGVSTLCIVNARRQAVELMNRTDEGRDDDQVFHLSTLLCGQHRREVLETIRKRLEAERDPIRKGPPTLLISTTVVEAGVDVDFTRVYRALAPLPSLIQGAGRCNREGRRSWETSQVHIFQTDDDAKPRDKIWAAQRDQTRTYIQADGEVCFEDLDILRDWFAEAIYKLNRGTDGPDVGPDLSKYWYETVARKVRLIEDDTVSVLAWGYLDRVWQPTTDADKRRRDAALQTLADAEARERLRREDWRILQPFCVSVYAHAARNLIEALPGLYICRGEYDMKTGLPLNYDPAENVVYAPETLVC